MCAKKKSVGNGFKEIRNGKAYHNYFVGDRFEAGIELRGTEVKAIRAGDAQISEAFCHIDKGECWLYNSHVGEYKFGNSQNHAPLRKRKLLLHRREINKLFGAMETGGKSLVPLRMYISHGIIKIEVALCTGKKLYDKREALKKKVVMREAARMVSDSNRNRL